MKTEKGKKKTTRTHTQALSWTGWHILAHPRRWGLAVCPIWTHIFTSLVSCWHRNVHTSSISGTQSLQLKWYPSLEHQTDALVDSNITCPQKYLRVWIRAWETVGELELSTCWKIKPGGGWSWKFYLCCPLCRTWFLNSFPSDAVTATDSTA